MKIIQAISSNNSLISESLNNKLLQYTDNAPWSKEDIDYKTLHQIIDKYDFELKDGTIPINSGMISLVFKAYKEDKPVIIKLKRLGIQEKLDSAIQNLLFLVYLLSFIPIFNKYQIAEVVNKNIEIIDFLDKGDFK